MFEQNEIFKVEDKIISAVLLAQEEEISILNKTLTRTQDECTRLLIENRLLRNEPCINCATKFNDYEEDQLQRLQLKR